LFKLIRCDEDIDILGKKLAYVAKERQRTYIRNTFDIDPQCTSSATEEADVLRAEMGFDYVDRTTDNFAYLISSWWARRHVVVICGRDEIPLAGLA
jgi:hypothetical protein